MLDSDIFEDDPERRRPMPWQARPIVVLDPSSFFRRLTVDILRNAGASRLTSTADPNEARGAIGEYRNPILISTWQSDSDEGLQLVRQIRQTPGTAQRSDIILLSPNRRTVDIEIARDTGISEYLARPFSMMDLTKRIKSIAATQPRFIESARFAGPDRRRPRAPASVAYKRGRDIAAGLVEPMDAALNQADDMAFQAMRRGDPTGARVGRSLKAFLQSIREIDASANEVIQLHRSTLARLDDLRSASPTVRTELVNGLERIVGHRIAA